MNYEKFMLHFNAKDNFSVNRGIKLTELKKGYAKSEAFTTEEDSYNFMGSVHGGFLSTMADITAGCAVISHGKMCVTLSSQINYLAPAKKGMLYAEANEIKYGNTICISQVNITDEDNKTVCICTATFFVKDIDAEEYIYGVNK